MSGAETETGQQPREAPEPNPVDIVWRRGFDKINYSYANIIMVLGKRKAGKSVLLECFGENYLAHGHRVLDLFGAADGEGLAWLRSPWAEDHEPLLIKGQNVDVKSSWHCLAWNELTLKDLEKHGIIISASPFYYRTRDFNEEFLASDKILDLLMSRIGWRDYFCIIAREASKLLFSRKKKYEDQLAAKQGAIYLLQECRHFGLSLVADAQKLTSIDSDIRSLCDFQIFKAQGMYMLPREYYFLYKWLDPNWLRSMNRDQFGILSANNSVGAGSNPKPSWHKNASENILASLGLQVEFGGEADAANFSVRNIMRDGEHAKIIKLYKEGTGSMLDVAQAIGRSIFIPYREINKHNAAIIQLQYCPSCMSAKGEYAKVLIEKKKRGKKAKGGDDASP